MIKRALISVSDKAGIVDFARRLHALGVEIISTGGTMKTLTEAGIPVKYVSDITGFPEIMDGRVKTLNPFIHGGILAVRDNEEHMAAMQKHGIAAIDLVVVNLYPFKQTIANPTATLEDAIENIDIGGPAMIRAAAKNFKYVTIAVNPIRYTAILNELEIAGAVSDGLRMKLAQEAFAHTAEYDAAISAYLLRKCEDSLFPEKINLCMTKVSGLRYGENAHQQAALYRIEGTVSGVAGAKQIHGKELSYNNIVDLDAAWNVVGEFSEPAATIIKHTNPCGTGIGSNIAEAYDKAYLADTVSAFGGIVACNREVDAATAEKIGAVFLEAVIAPGFSTEALSILQAKKNIRLIEATQDTDSVPEFKRVAGGMLAQEADRCLDDENDWKVVTKRMPSEDERKQLAFAWRVVKHVKSNAIVIANNNQTLGVGAGQMNRVGSAQIAAKQAGEKSRGAILASDAFFPFADTVEVAAEVGITAIIQPGGSLRDEESIEAADRHGIAMIFTGKRHFKH